MIDQELKERVLTFMRANMLTVISTIDANTNKPEAAVIAFAENENLELLFGTSNTSRKYKNIEKNSNVSFVIGWSDEFGTIQYEGNAREVVGNEALDHETVMAAKNPKAAKFFNRDDQRYFLVSPKWLRFTDKTKFPQDVLEVDF